MLVVAMKKNESVLIGDRVIVKLIAIHRSQIKLGIEAPADVLVLREKLAGKGKV